MHPGIVMMTAHPTPAHSETPTCLTLTNVGQHPEGLEHRPRDATYLHALHHHIHVHTTPRVVPWCLVHRYHLPSALPDRSRSHSYNLPTPVPVPQRRVMSSSWPCTIEPLKLAQLPCTRNPQRMATMQCHGSFSYHMKLPTEPSTA